MSRPGTIVEVGPDGDPSLVGRRAVLHSHESCGTCLYCAAGADNLCGKMRVFGVGTLGLGGWSEEVVVPARQLLTLRDNVDLAAACTYEVTYGTVLHNLRRGLDLTVLPGPVAIRGAPGALALAAAQFCVAMELPCALIVRAREGNRVGQLRRLLPEAAVVSEQDGVSTAFAVHSVRHPPSSSSRSEGAISRRTLSSSRVAVRSAFWARTWRRRQIFVLISYSSRESRCTGRRELRCRRWKRSQPLWRASS